MHEQRLKEQQERENEAIMLAMQLKRSLTYTDKDGCEVTVTPAGHVFYNAADWW
jgi:hypothetical protein